MAMDLIRKNNLELIKGVDRARSTTIAALRTAVIVAEALANQKMVLDQIDAINTTTNNMILKTSEMLKDQTARIHQQASNSGVSVETFSQLLTTYSRPWTRSTPSGPRLRRAWKERSMLLRPVWKRQSLILSVFVSPTDPSPVKLRNDGIRFFGSLFNGPSRDSEQGTDSEPLSDIEL